MFVTKNQFYVFLACLAFGAITGFVLSFLTCGVKLTRNKILENLTALIVLSLLGLIFTAYMFFMSFHIILAKFLKKFYNVIIKTIQKDKKVKYDRSKNKKNDSSVNGRGSVSIGDTSINNGLSNDSH